MIMTKLEQLKRKIMIVSILLSVIVLSGCVKKNLFVWERLWCNEGVNHARRVDKGMLIIVDWQKMIYRDWFEYRTKHFGHCMTVPYENIKVLTWHEHILHDYLPSSNYTWLN